MTNIVECRTPSLHITKLPNPRIKIFYHPFILGKNQLFLNIRLVVKSKQSQVKNQTQKNPMISGDSRTIIKMTHYHSSHHRAHLKKGKRGDSHLSFSHIHKFGAHMSPFRVVIAARHQHMGPTNNSQKKQKASCKTYHK